MLTRKMASCQSPFQRDFPLSCYPPPFLMKIFNPPSSVFRKVSSLPLKKEGFELWDFHVILMKPMDIVLCDLS